MNKLKKQIFIAMLAIVLPLVGKAQSLTLTVDQTTVCQGEVVTFTAEAFDISGMIQKYELFKDGAFIEQITTNVASCVFEGIVADVTAVYNAKVTFTGLMKGTVMSNDINLTVNMPTSSNTDVISCGSYTWHGQVYEESGLYTFDTINSAGCTHIDTLNLAINNGNVTSETIETCDSLLWHGLVLKESGNYQYDTTNVYGCDSILFLELTINHSDMVFDTVTACDFYEWEGTTYYQSGDYLYSTTNMHGCDSIMYLNLTINSMPEVVLVGDDIVCDNSESSYTTSITTNETLTYQWEIAGGTIVGADSTETITVKWDKPTAANKVSVEVINKNTGCFTNVEKGIQIQSFVHENLNEIVAKKNTNGIPYILIYPNPSSDYHYQWYKNDEPLEGETSQYLYINTNTSSEIDSVYRVYIGHVSDGNTLVCGKYSNYYVNNHALTNNAMSVSPNPVKRDDGINIYMDYQNDYSSIKIYSLEGKVVFVSEITENPMKIHVDFPKGLYIIEIIDNQGNRNFEKVIVK